jgi:putative aldouronate transport system permease protein
LLQATKRKKLFAGLLNRDLKKEFKRDYQLLIIILLPLAYYIIFHYIPMYGVVISFKDFSYSKGIIGSPWAGFKHFETFFASYYSWRLIRNTLLLGIYTLIFSFPVPIIFALALNELRSRKMRKIIQTVSYIPHFLSTVIIVGMIYNFFSVKYGIVNQFLVRIGVEPVNFMASLFWFRPLYVGSSIWQSFGFSSIIYLAAITGINPELYEALEVDGGNRWQKIRFITIPSISPTIIILLIFAFGRIFNVGFEKVLLMQSPGIYEVADVVQTFVYRRGIINGDFSFSAAVGLMNTLINFTLIVLFNYVARKVSDTSLW